jgi:hypothetical protein
MRPPLLRPASREKEQEMNQRTMDTQRALTAAAAAVMADGLSVSGAVNLHAKDQATHEHLLDALTCLLGEPDQHEHDGHRWAAWEPGTATIALHPPRVTTGSAADHAAGLVTPPDERWMNRPAAERQWQCARCGQAGYRHDPETGRCPQVAS